MEQTKYDVFISYSRVDTPIADQICDALDEANITYFIDRQGIGGGMEFPLVLARAIRESTLFLFLGSNSSYKSKFTINEITYAFNKKERNHILPYIIDDSCLPEDLEFVFAGINWRTLREHPIETILISDLLSLLNREKKYQIKIYPKLHSSKKQSKWGFVDYKGEYVIDCIWKDVNEFSEGFAAVKSENDRWGFINVKGEVVISCQWVQTGNFSDGLCVVTAENGKKGFIDNRGVVVIPCIWDDAFSISDGLIVVTDSHERFGVIDRFGNIIVPCQWDWMCSFSEGLAAVKNIEGKWGYIDKGGNNVIECEWDRALEFSEGLAAVENKYGKWGYVDHNGNNIIPCQWNWACPFSNRRACVENENRRMGFIDLSGKLVIPFVFYNKNVFREAIYKHGFRFQEGLAYVETENQHGFIDVHGNFIKMGSSGIWMRQPEDFIEGTAWVYVELDITPPGLDNCLCLEDRWRLIDKQGNLVDE